MKRKFSSRQQRIAYEGIRKVAKPFCDTKQELDDRCAEAIQLIKNDKYNQKIFFHYLVYGKLSKMVQTEMITSEGREKIITMVRSPDTEIEALGLQIIRSKLSTDKSNNDVRE